MPKTGTIRLSLALAAVLGTKGALALSCDTNPNIMGSMLANGLSCIGTTAGKTCDFICRANWSPTGPASCQNNGEWEQGPSCKPDCITEPTFPNIDTTFKCGATKQGDLCAFKCVAGYTASRSANCMMLGGQAMWANGPLCNAVATPPPVLLSTYMSVFAGATSVNVAHTYATGIVAYQATVTVSDRRNSETRVVNAVGEGNVLMFQEPLKYSYAPGQVKVVQEFTQQAAVVTAAAEVVVATAAPTTAAAATDPPTTPPAAEVVTEAPEVLTEAAGETRHQAAGKAAKATKGKKGDKGAKKDGKSKSGKGKAGKSGSLAAKQQVRQQRAITAVGATSLLAMVGMVGAVAAFIRRDTIKRLVITAPNSANHLLAEVAEPSMPAARVVGNMRGKVDGYMLPEPDAKVGDLIMGK